MKANPGKVLLQLRIEVDNMTFLGIDQGGFFLRNMWISEKGELKSRTIPITKAELKRLAEYVSRVEFQSESESA